MNLNFGSIAEDESNGYSDSTSYPDSDSSSSCSMDDMIYYDDDDDVDEDRMARQMMKMMKKHAGSVSRILIERAALIDSICWLVQHVPRCVLDDLFDDILLYCDDEEDETNHRKNPNGDLRLDSSDNNKNAKSLDMSTPRHSQRELQQDPVNGQSAADSLKEHATPIQKSIRKQSSSFLDPFADDSDDDSQLVEVVSAPRTPVFNDPFPFDSDDERERQKRLKNTTRFSSNLAAEDIERKSFTGANQQQDNGEYRPSTSPMTLPFASHRNCALLFVDISGFTKLSQILDVENLSKVIGYGGDILKFAGDAIFAEWPVVEASHFSAQSAHLSRRQPCSLESCAASAAICATSIVKNCSNFPIIVPSVGGREDGGSKIGTLNVHCGVGVGYVAGVHVGDNEFRREYLLVGDPINQVSEAESAAALGEVAVSPEALEVLSKVFDFDESIYSITGSISSKPIVIASRSEHFFEIKYGVQLPSFLDKAATAKELKEDVSMRCDSLEIPQLQRLRQMIALYVHHVVGKDELATELSLRVNSSAHERHQAEAELRDVYTIFIMPLITAKLTGEEKKDRELFLVLSKILLVVNRELSKYRGHLRQFIVDDKGVVLIANFGLRGSTFPNMISGHGLPCTLAIYNALQEELDVDNQIGATYGAAYCGVVGGIRRHEFAVLGPSVNLAARMMCNACNPGILVDSQVRLKANKDFSFNALVPVKAKGYADPVAIFEPIKASAKRWGKANSDFVGRTLEVDALVRFAKDIAYSSGESKFMFIQAESGTGKSSLILSAVRKISLMGKKKVIITRNISNQGDQMIPFSMFRAIFKDVLAEIDGGRDDSAHSINTNTSQHSRGSSGDGDSSDMSSTRFSVAATSLDNFSFLVNELNAPPEFLEIVGHHILGIRGQRDKSAAKNFKAGSQEAIIDFMARAFMRCTSHADLVIMALDDAHLLDELSWKVIQILFKECPKLLIICASRPLKSYSLEVDPQFWAELHGHFSREMRFSEIYLLGLDEDGIRALISKILGVPINEIDRSFFIDLHTKSGGMPHFASQMLETIKKKELVAKLENGKTGWRKDVSNDQVADFNFSTVGELLVYRLDSLEASVRTTLHLCAVFGMEFHLLDVVAAYQNLLQLDDSEKESRATNVVSALNVAVNEGIIDQIYEGGQLDEDSDEEADQNDSSSSGDPQGLEIDTNIAYRFHHAMWQENILKLMLDSRKRLLHQIIAESLEQAANGRKRKVNNYYSMITLFGHWKASGNMLKASELALTIGRSFANVGLGKEAVKIFDEALEMWRHSSGDEDKTDVTTGFPQKVLDRLSVDDLKSVIQLHVDKGKCLSTLHIPKESVLAYDAALMVMQQSPASAHMKDRSITFPIFSGLFVLIKFGMIEQDKECTYEQEIVRRFVEETKIHGDPVHYGRALGMQAEVIARLGNVALALEHFDRLSEIYDVEQHSNEVCKSYGSDRSAQIFSLSVLWNLHIGNEKQALDLCEFCLKELLPKMDIKNVHNSMVFLWPLYQVLWERGQVKRMRTILEDFVFKPFQEHYGTGGFTFCLPLYKPAAMLLEIYDDDAVYDIEEKVNWVLEDGAGVFTDMFDNAMGNYGSTASQVTSEICLCLARKIDSPEVKRDLIIKGTALARTVKILCQGEDGTIKMRFTLDRTLRLIHALEKIAEEYDVTEEMIQNKKISKLPS